MLEQIQKFLPDDHPWREQIQYYDVISSTNDVLKEMANQGALHGKVLVANQQTGGRGRLGRSFLSPSDVGIYLSVLLRPNCAPSELMHLTCAAALGACDAIEKATGFRPGIKWTNDIVCHRKKVAGILTEIGLNQVQKVDYVIIGIGVNCCQSLEDFPEEIRSFAGSLSMVTGKTIDRARVAAELIKAFYQMDLCLLTEKERILKAYSKNCITLGQTVSVVRAETVRHGTALQIDDDGALVVAFTDGSIEAVNSGEVSVRGLYNYV